jgi:uncharacterized protein DUF2330
MARRLLALPALALGFLVMAAGPALACGGLVAPGHAEVLRKATTLAAWHDGLEHYVTGFQFAGSANKFGYIIPLPGNPTKIQKAGAWTLERLEREINPIVFERAVPAALAPVASNAVTILQQVTIEALDITVVRGGGPDVATWAEKNGFALTPDTPKVLGQYSDRGAIFALARFNNKAAVQRGLAEGQGTVIHFTIPTKAPWIPLHILALGKAPNEQVQADLFILTDQQPKLLPPLFDMTGMTVRANGWATQQLLTDLGSDRGMSWLPKSGMWFYALSLDTTASNVKADLSIDGGGPPLNAAGSTSPSTPAWAWFLIVLLGFGSLAVWVVWRPDRRRLSPA